ncbi:MAG: DUF2892 domain-containing protein [Gammaproteobacteria bacterium]|nr:MAG: DUF2892 domain-containing protein [Gammaproteobacteria bacterium]
MESISVTQLKQKLAQGESITIVDVRTLPEFHSERPAIRDLKNHPLDRIEQLEHPEDEPLYVICQSGNRSSQACQKLLRQGFTRLVNVEGGLLAWKKAGLPTEKTSGTFPIMRQVQIAAGSLVLLGTLGSLYIHPAWIWLAVFVGAGLTFAGLSGFCGMAILLGKMPWNRSMQKQPEAAS